MTYDELQTAFKTKNAIFSVPTEGINWDEDWNTDKFADKDFPTTIARKGKITLKHTVFGEDIFFKKTFTNPTWIDVMTFFDKAIEEVGDYHHIFLEDIYENGEICAGS